ncbi:MAG: putative toxin-antitoxin system toxin component, PIN family [candidate division NC10 bacterium]|nr:putative toxin-antitoxin system toxin component, PIN family [candidate division NC10 bacterium]MDE2321446.1 putative toxin-antitoxin system toxin component, PIN family [candidate division NC10 bacterium]
MRVFLDTNVLASAAATRGLCADVLREVLTSHELLTSARVLSELRRVLRIKFGIAQDLIADFIGLLRQDTVLGQPGRLPTVDIEDQDDLLILSAAISAGADLFVTDDQELLDIGHIEDLTILSPRQFWEKLKAPLQRGAGRGKVRRLR